MSLDAILKAYGAAWSQRDEAKRRDLLEQAWSETGRYQDPSADVVGREALVRHIGSVHAQFPGARVDVTSAPSTHHGHVYFTWHMVAADGSIMIEGVDFGTLAPDRRLAAIVGFFVAPTSGA